MADTTVDDPRTRYVIYGGIGLFAAGIAASAITEGHVLSGVVLLVGYLVLCLGVLGDAYVAGRSDIDWPGGSRWAYALGSLLFPPLAVAYLLRRREYRALTERERRGGA
jgi:hypothetical protein